ncbi:aspartyl protease family protein At5g10770-like [Dendrobium catenatum]|uniref:Protein ASPARTIC PROTEASE IN GUARD CELL 2 n=1 Tax=Dendrobium catenatum TaxID=906689 RepID=A0A2I0VZW7_9ASPA|nr:aspartyl protease family protein At5g10770-like [Dendrobium catenatum]PKU68950.1 Protein ASPARTIC PROTEASE IN GUARD CELL 2 [Dendrobium catenatum]
MHQDKPSHVELLRQDRARVDYIHRRASNATAHLNPIGDSLSVRVPAIIDYSISRYSFIVNIGLGNPTKFFSFTLDTASDLTWTQCVPCVNCYDQKNPFYDPTQSFNFTNIPCNSNYCTELTRFGCSSTFTCLYEEEYIDYSKTNGSLLKDTLHLSNDIIYDFIFGCGHNNTGNFEHEDGVLGLGRGPISIINQTPQLYNKIFSYCLPSRPDRIGYLELGSSVLGVKYTPMLTYPEMPSYYFLNLTAISIAGEKLALPPTIFSGPGTMLDSGTIISHLPPTAYSALRNIFRKEMSNYPMAPPLFNLDTCYNFTNYPQVVVPEVSLIYDGEVIINLNFIGIFIMFSESQACLAFAENDDDTDFVIIGNMQHLTFNIVYDVGNLQIGFGANGCS